MAYKPLRNMNDDEALLYAHSLYTIFRKDKLASIARQERYDAIYRALDPPDLRIDQSTGTIADDQSSHSDSYLAVGAAFVDSAVAQLYSLLFSTDDYMRMRANDWNDHFKFDRITAHMKIQHREMKFRYKVFEALQQACCFDYCVTYGRWLLEEGLVNQRVDEIQYSRLGKLQVPFKRVGIEQKWRPDAVDRPDFQILDFDHSYHDPKARNGFEDSEAFFDDRDESIEWLYGQEKTEDRPWGRYKNIAEVEKIALQDQVIDTLPNLDGIELTTLIDDSGNEIRRRVRVHRLWSRDHLMEWSHGKVLRRLDLAGWPLQLWKIYNVSRKFQGMGLLQRIERQQYDINADVNSRRDFKNLVADPFGIIDEDLLQADGGGGQVESGRLIPAKGGNMSEKIWLYSPGQNIGQDAMNDLTQQIDIMQKSTQVSSNQMQSFASGRRPATEVATVAQAALTADQVIGLKIEDNALVPYYMYQFQLNQLNMTRAKTFQYFGQYGDEFIEVHPADYAFNAQPTFECLGTMGVIQDAQKTQQFMLAVDRAIQVPQLHNMPNIFVEMWRRLAPKDYHNFVKDPTIPQHNVPAQMENMLIAMGHHVEVSPLNDNPAHIAGHQAVKQTPDYQFWPEARKMQLERHIQDHVQAEQSQGSVAPQQQIGRPMQDQADALRGMRPQAVQ